MLRLLLVTSTLLMACFAHGSGWISSGGELFRDGKNPWFVRNTQMVSYCVQIDTASFSASQSDVEIAIKEGFEYWKNEFARSPSMATDGTFEVGTQSFQQVPCSAAVDITFQFGYGTLNQLQLSNLKDPKRYIGVTVRTDYDLKNLKGKGFVFFSSDMGPNVYDNPGSLIDKAWAHPKLLKYAILHELGHVFGIPHMGSGLMSEVFLNQILNKNLFRIYEDNPIDAFIRPANVIELCEAFNRAWLNVPMSNGCIGLEAPVLMGTWKVYTKKDLNSPREELGEIRSVTPNHFDSRGKPAIILELGDEQKVFTQSEAVFRSFMTGPFLMDTGLTGTFFPKSGKPPTPVYISITPTSVTITGLTSSSRIEPVITFNSLISVLLLKPVKP